MAQTTVEQLAQEVGIDVDRLLARLDAAGVAAKGADDAIGDEDKLKLLRHLREGGSAKAAGDGGKRISLRRRSTSELKLSGGRGAPARTVSVEVRKRRTYVNRAQEAEDKLKADAEAEARAAAEIAEREREAAAAQAAEAERTAKDDAEKDAAQQQAMPEQTEQGEAAVADSEAPAASSADEAAEAATPEPAAEEGQAKAPRKRRAAARPERVVDDARSRAQENLRRAADSHGRTKEDAERERSRAQRQELHVAEGKQGRRKKRTRGRPGRVQVQTEHVFEKPTAPVVRDVDIPDTITVGELAQRMAIKANELMKQMMKLGVMATINQTIDQDTAVLLVEEVGHNPRLVKETTAEETLLQEVRAEESGMLAKPRAPVVTVMGHVDHGKTSLLDRIRRTKVAAGEAGGITQHIGAYHVAHDKGNITFIDTPGHAAFTRMRARGAGITDIAVLVVAADDGVMPQTKESIQHARAAGVPIVVAITKADVDNADIERVKSGLSAEDVIPEDWGGDIQMVPVSSVTGAGVDELLDAIVLQAEILELTAPDDVPARGVVVESRLDKGRGPVATVLIKAGTLKRGDYLLAGSHHGRVRALFNESGEQVKGAGPSIPVEVLGLSGTPEAGDETLVVANERKAREIAGVRDERMRETKLAQQQAARMEEVFSKIGEDGVESKELNLLVKGDVQGSVEALVESLKKIPSEEVRVRIIASGVGGISESDVELALASRATIIGFNVRADAKARKSVQETGVDLRYYSVIYEAIQDVSDAISGLLGTELREDIVGLAEVREVFRSSKLGAVAGCLVVDGFVSRGLPIRVLRDNVVIYEGELESLRRHKDEARRVEAGTECGIGVKNYNDVKAGDQIECYERVEVQRSVEAEAPA